MQSYFTAQLPAVHIRHHNVQNYEIYPFFLQYRQSLYSIASFQYSFHPCLLQKYLQQLSDMMIVINNEYSSHSIHPL
ncbi:hypothetical protein D3C81_1978860 [compost metagenome]